MSPAKVRDFGREKAFVPDQKLYLVAETTNPDNSASAWPRTVKYLKITYVVS